MAGLTCMYSSKRGGERKGGREEEKLEIET
jgi:hypothetical protein